MLAKRDLPIFFNSDGGLVSQAVQIGLILRENRMTAGVARTVPEGVNRRGKLTPDRRPILTPLSDGLGGSARAGGAGRGCGAGASAGWCVDPQRGS